MFTCKGCKFRARYRVGGGHHFSACSSIIIICKHMRYHKGTCRVTCSCIANQSFPWKLSQSGSGSKVMFTCKYVHVMQVDQVKIDPKAINRQCADPLDKRLLKLQLINSIQHQVLDYQAIHVHVYAVFIPKVYRPSLAFITESPLMWVCG